MIRLRQIGVTRWKKRPLYQVQEVSANGEIESSVMTDDPALKVEEISQLGDLQAAMDAAHEAWERSDPEWQNL